VSSHRYRQRSGFSSTRGADRGYVKVYTEKAVTYPHPMMHKWKCPCCLTLNSEMAKGSTGTGRRRCSHCGGEYRLWRPSGDRRRR